MGSNRSTMPRKNFGGGESSISFGGDDAPAPTVSPSKPQFQGNPNFQNSISFGDDSAPVAPSLASGRAQFAAANQSSLIFDDSVPAPAATRTAGGGVSGSTCDNTIGSVPSVKVHHAPGGGSSICFGDDSSAPPARAPVAAPVAVAPTSPQYEDEFSKTSNRTASRSTGGLQNCGNKIGSVPSVKLHHAPGGSSSICFGDDSSSPFAPVAAAPAPVVPAVHIVKHESFHSKESPFAQEGQHQTAAPISQRGGMQAPGGASTLSFGDDSVVAAPVVKRAPGGTSTLSFGDDTEGFTPRYVAPAPQMAPVVRATAAQHYSSESPFAVANQTAAPATVRAAQAPGGSSTLSFGDDGEGFAKRYVAPAPELSPVIRATAAQQHKAESPFDNSYVEEAQPERTRTAGAGVSGSTCNSTIGDVPSVRLHAPPGGASSISFG